MASPEWRTSLGWSRGQLGAFVTLWLAAVASSGLYAVLAEREYRVDLVLAPVEEDDLAAAVGGLAAPLSGLAALVGAPGGERAEVAVATLVGRQFTEAYVAEQQLLPRMFPDRWDAGAKRWRGSPPTTADAYWQLEKGGVRTLLRDRRTGLITLRFEHADRELLAEMAIGMVDRLNRQLREREAKDATDSIRFLTEELNSHQQVEIRASIYRLIEAQLKRRMLSSVRQEFALRVVDFAGAPPEDDSVWPRPTLIVCMGVVLGGIAAALVLFAYRAAREFSR